MGGTSLIIGSIAIALIIVLLSEKIILSASIRSKSSTKDELDDSETPVPVLFKNQKDFQKYFIEKPLYQKSLEDKESLKKKLSQLRWIVLLFIILIVYLLMQENLS